MAVALPNLLGQVGRARQAEGKNAVGIMNRAQQAYHLEMRQFTSISITGYSSGNNRLGLVLSSRYYTFSSMAPNPLTSIPIAWNWATAVDGTNQGSRNFFGAVGYSNAGKYSSVTCAGNNILDPAVLYLYIDDVTFELQGCPGGWQIK